MWPKIIHIVFTSSHKTRCVKIPQYYFLSFCLFSSSLSRSAFSSSSFFTFFSAFFNSVFIFLKSFWVCFNLVRDAETLTVFNVLWPFSFFLWLCFVYSNLRLSDLAQNCAFGSDAFQSIKKKINLLNMLNLQIFHGRSNRV